MNIKLLRQVQKRLIKQSQDQKHCRFNMKYFVAPTEQVSNKLEEPVCGTQACIAGETLIMSGKAKFSRKNKYYVFPDGMTEANTAAKILGLNTEQANRLFYFKDWAPGGLGWPEDLRVAYDSAETGMEQALIGAARIERFIQTEGLE